MLSFLLFDIIWFFITFGKINDAMSETAENRTRTQTIFRFDAKFIDKLKYYARIEEKSLNAYVEAILQTEINRRESLPKLSLSGDYSQKLNRLSSILAGKIAPEDLDNDDRLAYILNK